MTQALAMASAPARKRTDLVAKADAIAVYALTEAGLKQARILAGYLGSAHLLVSQRLAGRAPEARVFDRLADALAKNWRAYSGHVAVCATGIVVRAIGPLLESKDQDPAVVVVDQAGRYAVSLLSGHLGGANQLAVQVAALLGGQAVISTATDLAELPSLEMVAAQAGCTVGNLRALAAVSADLIDGRTVDIYDPGRWLAGAMLPWADCLVWLEMPPGPAPEAHPLVWVGPELLDPPRSWLVLRPPCLVVGIGCNRNTERAEIEAFMARVFDRARLSRACIAVLASVEDKANEAGLLELAQALGRKIVFFPRDEINKIEVPNPSDMVQKHLGVKSVCEAAAMLAARSPSLLVEKQKKGNVTMAVALAGSGW